MKVSINEIHKDKVYVFMAPDATPEELAGFDLKVREWMNKNFSGVPSSFYLRTIDGGKVIVSILDVNSGLERPQFQEDW